jgi:hypothetical protein
VVSIPIETAAAKIAAALLPTMMRTTPPIWAGVLPLSLTPGTAIPDPRLVTGVDVSCVCSTLSETVD